MLGVAANSVSIGNLMVVGMGVVLAIPTSILTIHSLQDRSLKARRGRQVQRQRQDELNRLTELIAKKILGENAVNDPDRAEQNIKDGQSLTATIEAIGHQVRPSNGKTMARTVEETRADMMKLAVLVGEHMSDGHGGQTWPGTP